MSEVQVLMAALIKGGVEMKRKVFIAGVMLFATACTTQNDVIIQTAFANARAQECIAVADIAKSGAASEAAVLMAARGCGNMQIPQTGTDKFLNVISAVSPLMSSVVAGAVSLKNAETLSETQKEANKTAIETARIDADVLKTLGQDQVVTVRPEVVLAPDPIIVEQPEPIVVEAPEPVIVEQPEPTIVQAPEPTIVQPPAPEIVFTPDPIIVEMPAPEIVDRDVCTVNSDGSVYCR